MGLKIKSTKDLSTSSKTTTAQHDKNMQTMELIEKLYLSLSSMPAYNDKMSHVDEVLSRALDHLQVIKENVRATRINVEEIDKIKSLNDLTK